MIRLVPPVLRPVWRRCAAHAFEVAVPILLALEAVGMIVGQPAPKTVEAAFPLWLRLGWGWELLIGSVLVLAGVLAGKRKIYVPGMVLYVGCATFFVAALLIAHPPGFTLSAVSDAILGAAAAVRANDVRNRPWV